MMYRGKCTAHMIAWVLVIIGGLNWGLVGAFNYNLVDGIFGVGSMVARIIYVVVGLATIFMLLEVKCKKCKGHMCKGCGVKMEDKMEGGMKGGMGSSGEKM